jgi:hypothetical protein
VEWTTNFSSNNVRFNTGDTLEVIDVILNLFPSNNHPNHYVISIYGYENEIEPGTQHGSAIYHTSTGKFVPFPNEPMKLGIGHKISQLMVTIRKPNGSLADKDIILPGSYVYLHINRA